MRLFLLVLVSVAIVGVESAPAQAPTLGPGIHQAEQAETQSEKNIPPPEPRHLTVDYAKLRRDAEKLASLAQAVPADIDQTSKGMLPKDLAEKLKRIQKLAKQLQSQIGR